MGLGSDRAPSYHELVVLLSPHRRHLLRVEQHSRPIPTCNAQHLPIPVEGSQAALVLSHLHSAELTLGFLGHIGGLLEDEVSDQQLLSCSLGKTA